MSEIRYNRNVTNTKPAVFDRELPRDWKYPTDCSPIWWKEAAGILIAAVLIFGLPWIFNLAQAALQGVAK